MLETVRIAGTVPNLVALLAIATYVAGAVFMLISLPYNQRGSHVYTQRSRTCKVAVAASASTITTIYLTVTLGPVQIVQSLLKYESNGNWFQIAVFAAMGLGLLTVISSPFVAVFIKNNASWAHHRTKLGHYVDTTEWRRITEITPDAIERRRLRGSLPLYHWTRAPVNSFALIRLPADQL